MKDDAILREIIEETIAKSHRQWRSIPETAYLVLVAIEDYQKAPKDAYEGKGKRAYYSARADMFEGLLSPTLRKTNPELYNSYLRSMKSFRDRAGQLPIEGG